MLQGEQARICEQHGALVQIALQGKELAVLRGLLQRTVHLLAGLIVPFQGIHERTRKSSSSLVSGAYRGGMGQQFPGPGVLVLKVICLRGTKGRLAIIGTTLEDCLVVPPAASA